MPNADEIRRMAQERGKSLGLSYAGALLPDEAHALLQSGVRLVDVRTAAELYWVGRVPGAVELEWNSWPGTQPNTAFLAQLAGHVGKGDPLMFLCRSGARSHHAAVAATQAGYAECYNILEGFEGDKDPMQHRNSVNGWRLRGLPWMQS
ncbi:MAG: rhodanese-like domain-containing protein [Betaproteobacteria bacterium]|nr:rhodanese-like domain-containing protein [Betaproteobacteria bacterium]